MKYVIIIPDGCADLPISSLGERTPMQAAHTPNLTRLAQTGMVGRSVNVPAGMPPGSDVATLGLLGYDPRLYYTGRAPLEAAAMGVAFRPGDWQIRCNLVYIDGGIMKSFTAGHISSHEASDFINTLNESLSPSSAIPLQFYAGVSYRNLAVSGAGSPFSAETKTYPPHDFTDRAVEPALPTGTGSDWLRSLMEQSRTLFERHPVNQKRTAQNKLPCSQIWLWGQGQKPELPPFAEKYTSVLERQPFRGAMITAVDLLKGIAAFIGWDNIKVPGITGYGDTDYAAKGTYAAKALQDYDIVCVHVEATDELGHDGDAEKKVKALEDIDSQVLPPVLDALQSCGDWRILVSPDHPTPCALKTHTSDYVPWLIAGNGIKTEYPVLSYDEETARNSPYRFDNGWEMLEMFLRGTF